MAMAKPVIVSERFDLGDYLVDGRSGRIVEPEEPSQLRTVIQETFEDEPLRDRLGTAACEAVGERHTMRHFAERVAAIIRTTMPT
jgi:glycosyltransferase involved in cell wall biosynthesis